MLPESNPKKSCRGSHHALRLHRNLLQSQAPPLSARLSLPTRVRKTLEQSNKPTKLNNCLSAFSKTDQGVQCAPLPPRIIEKGLASDRVVIDTVVSKYADHLPLYRQSVILERETGIDLSRATLDGWVMRV